MDLKILKKKENQNRKDVLINEYNKNNRFMD